MLQETTCSRIAFFLFIEDCRHLEILVISLPNKLNFLSIGVKDNVGICECESVAESLLLKKPVEEWAQLNAAAAASDGDEQMLQMLY